MPRSQNYKLVRMHKIEIEPCPFIQHVGIEALGPKQADLGNQFLALRCQDSQLSLQLGNLALDHSPTDHTELTAHGVKAKIAKRRDSDRGRDQTTKKRLFSLTGSCSGHSLDLNADTLASWFPYYAVLGLIES